MIYTCPRCQQDFEIDDTTCDVSDMADGCRDPDCQTKEPISSPWGDLRKHWEESYAREQANPPPDKPTHDEVIAGFKVGIGNEPTPVNTWVWVTELTAVGWTGVALAKLDDEGRWWLAEAGDLWPCHPTHWLPRKL